MDGYIAAMKDHGRTVSQDYIRCCPHDVRESYKFFESLAEEELQYDGIVTCEDTIAVSALKYALSKGISIPEQLSVVGSGNTILSQYCYPELTTVDGNYESLCVTAVNMLVRHLEGIPAPSRAVISSRLIRRNTTKSRNKE